MSNQDRDNPVSAFRNPLRRSGDSDLREHLGDLIVVGRDGIEIRDHDLGEVVEHLFADEEYLFLRKSNRSVGERILFQYQSYEYEFFSSDTESTVKLERVPCGIQEFFGTSGVLVDLGCGPGLAAFEIAQRFPNLSVVGVDYEFGDKIDYPPKSMSNLEYRSDSWNNLSLPDSSVERILSRSAAFVYGNPDKVVSEVTRIASRGAMLRGEYMASATGFAGDGYAFARQLAKKGWDVWKYDYTLIAQKK